MKFFVSRSSGRGYGRGDEKPLPAAIEAGNEWLIEVKSMKALLAMADDVPIIIRRRNGDIVNHLADNKSRPADLKAPYELEIYDDWRE